MSYLKKYLKYSNKLSGGSSGVNKWSCSTCTYLNNNSSANCEMCGSPKPKQENKSWACQQCTLINNGQSNKCSVCDASRTVGTSVNPSPGGGGSGEGTRGAGGSGGRPGRVIIMRHGERADNSQVAPWYAPGGGAWAPAAGEHPNSTPLANFTCPLKTYNELQANYGPVTKIVSSPFRRCLETAAYIAIKFGINNIYVNDNLGEVGNAGKGLALNEATMNAIIKRVYNEEPSIRDSRLTSIPTVIVTGRPREAGDNGRLRRAIWEETTSFYSTHPTSESLLIVSHGDIAQEIAGEAMIAYLLNYCGYYTMDSVTKRLYPGSNFEAGVSASPKDLQNGFADALKN